MEDLRQAAKRFLDDQFAIMRKHDSEPKLHEEQYDGLLTETERSLKRLAEPDSRD